MLSGIKSIIDTVIITPDAKLSADTSILFVFIFKNIGIVPNSVDKPASVVRINAFVFIVSPFKYMYLFLYY